MVDSIYEHIHQLGPGGYLPPALVPGLEDRTVTVNALSKTYAVTGWRVGWTLAPAEITAAIRKVHDFLTIAAPAPLQAAGVAALGLPASYYDGLAAVYRERRDLLCGALEELGFDLRRPDGSYYVLTDVGRLAPDGDGVAFARRLITEIGVSGVPAGLLLAAGERRAGPGEGALRVPQAPGDAARGHRPTRKAPVTRAAADAGAVRRGLVLIAAIWVAVACAAAPVPPTGPPDIAFTPVALPDGAVPEVLAADGDQLLVGVHRAAAPQPPGLVRRSPDGTVTEVPAQAVTGYGRTASWFSLAADGTRILAIGGDRGGAHGNVRWSVWTGSASGVAEHAQAFSTFGGWGAGDLIDAVLTPGGSAVVGSWESAEAGLDVAVWTPQGDDWVRRPSTGTPLQSTRAEVAFPTAATGFGPGVVVAGWQVGTGAGARPGAGGVAVRAGRRRAGTRPCYRTRARRARRRRSAARTRPVRWRARRTARWRCGASSTAGGAASRASRRSRSATPTGSPPRSTSDGSLTAVVADRGQVKVVEAGETPSTHNAAGPTGAVTAAVRVGPSAFVVAGDRLWQADVAALH